MNGKSGKREKTSCPDPLSLSAYLDGRAKEEESEAIEAHLISCKNCLEAIGELREILKSPVFDIPPGIISNAKALIVTKGEEKRGSVIPFPVSRRGMFSAYQKTLGWAAAAGLALVVGSAGYKLGGNTFQNTVEISSLLSEQAAIATAGILDPLDLQMELEPVSPGGEE